MYMIEGHAARQRVSFKISKGEGVVGVDFGDLPWPKVWASEFALNTEWPVDVSHHHHVSSLETGGAPVRIGTVMLTALGTRVSFTQRTKVRGELVQPIVLGSFPSFVEAHSRPVTLPQASVGGWERGFRWLDRLGRCE